MSNNKNNNDNNNEQEDLTLLYNQAYPKIEQFIPNPRNNKNKNDDDDENTEFASVKSHRGHVNYYTLLGCSPTDSDAEIRRAFRHLSVMFHPDRTVTLAKEVADAMSARFRLINEAYQVLSDPIKRAAYDCLGKQGVKELGQLIPAALTDDNDQEKANLLARYLRKHPEAVAALLKTAHEEKNLIKTAKRLGNNSEVEIQLNAVPLVNQIKQVATDILELSAMYLAQNQDKIQWNMPWDDPERNARIEKDVELVRKIVKKRMEHDRMMKELEASSSLETSTTTQQQQETSLDDQQEPAFYNGNDDDDKKMKNKSSNNNSKMSSSSEQNQQQETTSSPQNNNNNEENNTNNNNLPPPPPVPADMKVSLNGPAAVLVNYNGQQTLALVPDDPEKAKVLETVKNFQKVAEQYKKDRMEYEQLVAAKKKEEEDRKREERIKKLEERRDKMMKILKEKKAKDENSLTPSEEKLLSQFESWSKDENNNNLSLLLAQEDEKEKLQDLEKMEEQNPESQIDPQTGLFHGLPIPSDLHQHIDTSKSTRRYHRPPLWQLCSKAGQIWCLALTKHCKNTLIPLTMQGRYAWQLPMGDKTASLFSVTAARRQNGQATFDVGCDAEYRSSSLMTWIWNLGINAENGGTKGAVGFQRILSKVWIAKMKFFLWQAGSKFWLPEIFIQFQRKLSETLTLLPHIRLPSPFMFMDFLGGEENNLKNNNNDLEKIQKELGVQLKENNNGGEEVVSCC